MPSRHARQVEIEILICKMAPKFFLKSSAEIAISRHRHEMIHNRLSMRPADHGVDAREVAKATIGCSPFACDATHHRARPEGVAYVEYACKFPDLEPDIASESFIRSLACEHNLVTLCLHLAGKRQQRGARSVQNWAFRRDRERSIGVHDAIWSSLHHGRVAVADRAGSFQGAVDLVEI